MPHLNLGQPYDIDTQYNKSLQIFNKIKGGLNKIRHKHRKSKKRKSKKRKHTHKKRKHYGGTIHNPTFSTGHLHLTPQTSMLANPIPYTLLHPTTNLIDNYNHYTRTGY